MPAKMLAIVVAVSLFSAGSFLAAEELPLVCQDDFESGADAWEPTDASAWKIDQADRGKIYSQFKKRSKYDPPHRSPYNISLLKGHQVGDFVLTVDVLSTHPDYGHRDACLFFGYQDAGHFYYVHLGKVGDPHSNQIMIVDGKARTKISLTTTPGTHWDDNWHKVKIVRDVDDGRIDIFFDDMKKPALTANDKTFQHGRVGVGSFDDTTAWDNFRLEGVTVEK